MLTWQYPFTAATRRAAKASVTALRRQAADELDDEAEQVSRFARPSTAGRIADRVEAKRRRANSEIISRGNRRSASQISATPRPGKRERRCRAQIRSRAPGTEKVLSADEGGIGFGSHRRVLGFTAGKENPRAGGQCPARTGFYGKIQPAGTGRNHRHKNRGAAGKRICRGARRGGFGRLLPEELWLVDFKTDAVRAGELPEKTKIYAPQLKLYARALSKIYSRPVTNCWLHFLSARQTEAVDV